MAEKDASRSSVTSMGTLQPCASGSVGRGLQPSALAISGALTFLVEGTGDFG